MNTYGDYEQFKQLFHHLTGIQLDAYKRPQMERRLLSLCEKRQFATLAEYGEALKKDEVLLDECVDKVTINVSSFFRNYNRWQMLSKTILPLLNNNKTGLRIWSSASSTGEEPYTLAIMCDLAKRSLENGVIMASDIDEEALIQAKRGHYKPRGLKEVPEPIIKDYFEEEESGVIVKKHIRKMVNFTRIDLLNDAYPKRCDLIVCRNVLIYFTDEAKRKIFIKLSNALVTGGVLFVGSTEQIFKPEQYGLKAVAPFFYQKIELKK
ncbi:CheR family methyltransferase [Shouchella patagoniensis]|uniref:CheR family methyltransferase n=1 Tax=Shouchella patagoniensis TaxID=228576 RepID=UPI000994B1A5|nr:protein-glutamate O-methyltransferase CheR [Shouchella patagoniensis]